MSSVNKVIIVGNLGRDPEMGQTHGGDAVANLSVATSEKWKDKHTGEDREQTEWHRVVAFGRLAEVMGQYLKKGSKVYLEGKLSTRKWTDKDGNDRWTTEVVISGFNGQMVMLDSRGGGGSSNSPYASQGPSNRDGFNQDRGVDPGSDIDDEIPF